MCCQGNHGTGSRDCEVWKKEIDYQTKTYSKHHLPRSEKDGRDYKICGSDKKNIPTTKKQSCYVGNKRNYKTRGDCPPCKQNESADPGDEIPH